jgi:hypothetical protein
MASLGALLASLNMSTLVIALPSFLCSLHRGVIEVAWVLLSFLLAQTAVVLSAGRLGMAENPCKQGNLRSSPRWPWRPVWRTPRCLRSHCVFSPAAAVR